MLDIYRKKIMCWRKFLITCIFNKQWFYFYFIFLHLLNINIRSFSSEIFLLHCTLKFHTIYYIFRLCITLSVFMYKMILIINLWFHLNIISIQKRNKQKIIKWKRKNKKKKNIEKSKIIPYSIPSTYSPAV
jgi:hypothetical protein